MLIHANKMLEQLATLLSDTLEYIVISLLLATAGLLVSSKWRETKTFFFAAVISGSVTGITAKYTPFLQNIDFLLVVFATITGPATISAFQNKTMVELYITLKKLRDNKNTDDEDDVDNNSSKKVDIPPQ